MLSLDVIVTEDHAYMCYFPPRKWSLAFTFSIKQGKENKVSPDDFEFLQLSEMKITPDLQTPFAENNDLEHDCWYHWISENGFRANQRIYMTILLDKACLLTNSFDPDMTFCSCSSSQQVGEYIC